jgi:glucosamine kinase
VNRSDVFVGVDGGGSRSLALVLDAHGAELARMEGGPGAVSAGHIEAVTTHLVSLVSHALRTAGHAPPAGSLVCGLAGAGAPGVAARLVQRLTDAALAHHAHVCTDAEVAHYDAFEAGPGMLLISGTGSIAWGRSDDGRTGRVGGWGPLLGDEGSGFAIGLAALRAVVRAADGRARPTALTDVVARHTGAAVPESLVVWAGSAERRAIALLAPAVLEAAEADATAGDIMERAVLALAGHVSALHARLDPWRQPPAIAFAGSLLTPGTPLRAALESSPLLARPDLVLLESTVFPARGAARMAIGRSSSQGSL